MTELDVFQTPLLRFESFDYGAVENLKRYGQSTPIQYMQHYDKVDCTVHFVAGISWHHRFSARTEVIVATRFREWVGRWVGACNHFPSGRPP